MKENPYAKYKSIDNPYAKYKSGDTGGVAVNPIELDMPKGTTTRMVDGVQQFILPDGTIRTPQRGKAAQPKPIESNIEQQVQPDSLSGDLRTRGGNIKQEFLRTLTGEKPVVNLPFRYAGQVGGAVTDVGARTLSAITPDVIEEPIKKYVGQAAQYIAGTKPAQLVGQGYQYAREKAPDVMDTLEGAVNFSAAAPITKVGAKAITKPIATAADIATPNIPRGMAEVTSLAQKYEIPVSLPQVTESRALQNVQKVSQELPFSGAAGFRDKQLSKWQESIFGTMGIKADRFSPSVMNMAFRKVGGEFDDLTKNKQFNVGGTLEKRIYDITEDVDNAYSADAMRALEKQVMPIINKIDGQGNIRGDDLSFFRRKLNALGRKAKDEEKKAVFQDLENAIVESITSNDPILKAKLQKAKYNYKNLIAVEPLAVKAKKGFINPTLLNQRLAQVYGRAHTTGQSGDIGELARIGHELLGELGGSDTTQKMLYSGAALGGGYVDPLTTTSILAGNRAAQSGLLRNQSLIKRKVQKSLKGNE